MLHKCIRIGLVMHFKLQSIIIAWLNSSRYFLKITIIKTIKVITTIHWKPRELFTLKKSIKSIISICPFKLMSQQSTKLRHPRSKAIITHSAAMKDRREKFVGGEKSQPASMDDLKNCHQRVVSLRDKWQRRRRPTQTTHTRCERAGEEKIDNFTYQMPCFQLNFVYQQKIAREDFPSKTNFTLSRRPFVSLVFFRSHGASQSSKRKGFSLLRFSIFIHQWDAQRFRSFFSLFCIHISYLSLTTVCGSIQGKLEEIYWFRCGKKLNAIIAD